jgi:tryptophan synthase alpha chain
LRTERRSSPYHLRRSDIETTKACVREMVRSGADLIELGIPFSDPTAEGPVIQEANIRALSGGSQRI